MIAARTVLGALVGLGLGACFNAPGGPVLFSCDPDDAPQCPPGYECRSDGCCHDVDTPDGDNVGACKLELGPSTDAGSGTASDSGDTASDSGDTASGSGDTASGSGDTASGSGDTASGSGSDTQTSTDSGTASDDATTAP